MEVRGQQPGGADEARARFRKVQAELAQANRERVQRARENLENLPLRRHQAAQEQARANQAKEADQRAQEGTQPGIAQGSQPERRSSDEILTGQTDAGQGAADGRDRIELSGQVLGVDPASDPERSARVEALRNAYLEGTLGTPERVERAAVRLLGGDEESAPSVELN